MQVAILAGGLGTRLQGVLDAGVPKPMVDVAGRPFLEWIIADAVAQGATSLLLLTGHGHAAIEDHFGERFGDIPLTYSAEPAPLGTGGALRNALPRLAPTFVLMNGDTVAPINLAALWSRLHDSPLVMTVAAVADVGRYGAVRLEGGRVLGLGEKRGEGPGFINAGTYGMHRDLVERLPEGPSSLERDLLEAAAATLQPPYVEAHGTFCDLGVPADLERMRQLFAQREAGEAPRR